MAHFRGKMAVLRNTERSIIIIIFNDKFLILKLFQ